MKCSDCSKRVTPVVVSDIDGTLGAYHEPFIGFCSRYFSIPVPVNEPYDGSVEMEEWIGITKVQYREAKLAYRQGGNKRWMPAYDGASDFAHAVREAGAEFWVATSRPWQRLDNIDPDTRFWLAQNDISFDGLLYGEDKYIQLVNNVDRSRVVLVVDDLPEQLEKASNLQLPYFQVDRPHNSFGFLRWSPRGDLRDAMVAAQQRIEGWFNAVNSD